MNISDLSLSFINNYNLSDYDKCIDILKKKMNIVNNSNILNLILSTKSNIIFDFIFEYIEIFTIDNILQCIFDIYKLKKIVYYKSLQRDCIDLIFNMCNDINIENKILQKIKDDINSNNLKTLINKKSINIFSKLVFKKELFYNSNIIYELNNKDVYDKLSFLLYNNIDLSIQDIDYIIKRFNTYDIIKLIIDNKSENNIILMHICYSLNINEDSIIYILNKFNINPRYLFISDSSLFRVYIHTGYYQKNKIEYDDIITFIKKIFYKDINSVLFSYL